MLVGWAAADEQVEFDRLEMKFTLYAIQQTKKGLCNVFFISAMVMLVVVVFMARILLLTYLPTCAGQVKLN